MLLFSAILSINEKMTEDSFIQLVIKWNQGSPHKRDIVQGLDWHGERNIRYGTDLLWLSVEEYKHKHIIAVRYEKTEKNGVVWQTDFIMNFNEMKLSVQLDRSCSNKVLMRTSVFLTPYFITLLIKKGYLQNDGDLPVLFTPIIIRSDNVTVLTDIINGNMQYQLPVVYVSKTDNEKDPIDVSRLSERLKGIAHILVEESFSLNPVICENCDDCNELNGSIGIYYPNANQEKLIYRPIEGIDVELFEGIVRKVFLYCNSMVKDELYTWQGVHAAILRDRLAGLEEQLTPEQNKETQRKQQVPEMQQAQQEQSTQQVPEMQQAQQEQSTQQVPVMQQEHESQQDRNFAKTQSVSLLDRLKAFFAGLLKQ